MGVSRYRGTDSVLQKELRLYGGVNPTSGKKQHPTISKKWHFLIDAPFKISEKCCDILKKEPLRTFEKETGLKPITGMMAEESAFRVQEYLHTGCNAFEKNTLNLILYPYGPKKTYGILLINTKFHTPRSTTKELKELDVCFACLV